MTLNRDLFGKTRIWNLTPDKLTMSQERFEEWKQNVFEYQQKASRNEHQLTETIQIAPKQLSLFDTPASHCDPNEIDPFGLPLKPSQFYRQPEVGNKVCIYMIVDISMPILLYVGETKQTAKERWADHDCKDYILNYKELHRRHKMKSLVNSCFWYNTPNDRKARQKLELELINKWRSPFNKENWQYWGDRFKSH